MMDRTILHCDLNGFFASVELLYSPHLRDVPMAVAGDPEARHGIILAKNEPAKKSGVVTAETIWAAKQKCPGLILVPPRRGVYSEFSRKANEIYQRYTDLVEPFGIDESWLDISNTAHLVGDGETVAGKLRAAMKEELGLTISVGVSFNKIFAKLGSDMKKPDATTVINRGNFRRMIYPLDVKELLFVGRSMGKELNAVGIHTIGELAAFDPAVIERMLGKFGHTVWRYANGDDSDPVMPYGHREKAKSVGNGHTFSHDLIRGDEILAGITDLSDEVATRLRKHNLMCRSVTVTIKDNSLKQITRQKTLEEATDLAKILKDESMDILEKSWPKGKPIRMLTVTAGSLIDRDESVSQLNFTEPDKQAMTDRFSRLEGAVDEIRGKFGFESVVPGRLPRK